MTVCILQHNLEFVTHGPFKDSVWMVVLQSKAIVQAKSNSTVYFAERQQ